MGKAEKKGQGYQIDMIHGSLAGKLLVFAIPLMLSSILQLLFNAADVIVVGRWSGKEALAAVGSNTSLINLLVNLFMGFSVGTNVVVARDLGAGRKEAVRDSVHTSIAISLISGVVLTVLGLLLSRQMLELMGSPEDVIDLAAVYLRIYFCGMPGNMLYNFGAAILRAQGDTKRPLYFLTAAGIINVILNLVFVIIFHMDVAGVALATIISQYASAILELLPLMRDKGDIRVDLRALREDMKEVRRIHRRLPGRGVLPVQRGHPVLHQLLRLHGGGRLRRFRQHRGLRLRRHERLLPDGPHLHQPELRRLRV